jgi:hypothetical protein
MASVLYERAGLQRETVRAAGYPLCRVARVAILGVCVEERDSAWTTDRLEEAADMGHGRGFPPRIEAE